MPSEIYEYLEQTAKQIIANKDFLTELDREIGDSDHGINMARGFAAVVEKVPNDNNDFGAALKKTGMTLLSTVGGASGPLYGTAYMEAGKILAGKSEITPEDLQKVLEFAIAGIQKRGHAVKGEKTMLDAIIPAYEKYCESLSQNQNMIQALENACKAAEDGVEFTKTIIATKGRASYLGERSIGHQDPGATSATIILRTTLEFLRSRQS